MDAHGHDLVDAVVVLEEVVKVLGVVGERAHAVLTGFREALPAVGPLLGNEYAVLEVGVLHRDRRALQMKMVMLGELRVLNEQIVVLSSDG